MSLYLTALFDAQSRRPAGARVRNTRPLSGTGTELGWTDLLPAAVPGADMLRQVQRALTALERVRLVELRRPGMPARYEQFTLLDESGGGLRGRTGYVIPHRVAAADGDLLRLPAAFFVHGWVHVLLPAEILVYLMILDLEQVHGTAGIYAADSVKADVYAISRDVYEHHRALTAYGLIDRLDDPHRRPDGKLAPRPRFGGPPHPLRFRSVRGGLDRDAHPSVTNALQTGW
ncbi:hypothetical protein [Actinoplanes sp. NPDC026670]|uniref:hypothetical protein n=1 Tax=Actinoplanes sp. NPDC026670 TaxID=3154700 RepID=UPI0033C6926F